MSDTGDLYSLGVGRDTLNRKLGGGMPKSSIVLIEGEFGAGKSVVAQRFTWGFCNENYSMAYLTPELDLDGFLGQMKSLGYDITEALLDLRFLFLEIPIESGRRYIDKIMESEFAFQFN